MGRLPGFDYKRPFFYMVTLKRLPVLQGGASAPPFSSVSREGMVVPNAVTEAFEAEIAEWALFWRSVESVSPHVVMPDHLHLLVKLATVEKAVSLAVAVGDLRKRLNRAYWRVLQGAAQVLQQPAKVLQGAVQVLQGAAPAAPVLDPDWHDWIVKKEGQLAAFRTYILENPARHALRCANRRFFSRAREIEWRGARYWAYGNEALLELPVIVAVKGHRRPQVLQQPAQVLQQPASAGCMSSAPALGRADARPCKTAAALLAAASRIGPGGAGLSTFLSPLEKEAGNAIVKAGGALIVLSMKGFSPRWHPTEKQERLCASGRLLYLSPYPPQTAKLSKREMHIRAHALVDWALAHSHEQLEAWPEHGGAQVLQDAASAAPTLPSAPLTLFRALPPV